jgi:thioredoxin
MLIEIDDASFADGILRADRPVLAVFSAQWCGPCKHYTPVVEKLADDLEGALTVAKIDIDRAPEIASRYGVRMAPTTLLFRDGQVVAQHAGTMREPALRQFIDSAPGCRPSAAGR